MITINKNSWLHKFNRRFSFCGGWSADRQTNLCSYFWMTVGSIICLLLKTFVIIFLLSFAYALSVAIFSDITGIPVRSDSWESVPWWLWVFAPFVLPVMASCIVGAIFVLLFLLSVITDLIKGAKKKKKKPGLLRSYLKAKKDKYCPLLQVK